MFIRPVLAGSAFTRLCCFKGFPETFVLKGNLSQQVEQVSNAVPPPLARSVASAIRHCLQRGNAR